MNYDLPKTVINDGKELAIRYDFRVILDILEILNEADFSAAEKASAIIEIFYVNPEQITDFQEAINACFSFIDAGQEHKKKAGRLATGLSLYHCTDKPCAWGRDAVDPV